MSCPPEHGGGDTEGLCVELKDRAFFRWEGGGHASKKMAVEVFFSTSLDDRENSSRSLDLLHCSFSFGSSKGPFFSFILESSRLRFFFSSDSPPKRAKDDGEEEEGEERGVAMMMKEQQRRSGPASLSASSSRSLGATAARALLLLPLGLALFALLLQVREEI